MSASRIFAIVMLFTIAAFAQVTHSGSHSAHHHATYHRHLRSREVTRTFQRSHPCPSTGRRSGPCPGYVKDHVIALCAGGSDSASNLQWQTTAAAKAKDRVECGSIRKRR
jgi:hypothetical protein